MPRPEHPQDREMRQTPARPGLLERLRSVVVSDEALDDWLADIPVSTMEQRRCLEQITAWAAADEQLDAALADVPGDADIVTRLQQSLGECLWTEETLDEALDEAMLVAPARPDPTASTVPATPTPATPAPATTLATPARASHCVPAPAIDLDGASTPVRPRVRDGQRSRKRVSRWIGAVTTLALLLIQASGWWALGYAIRPAEVAPLALDLPSAGPLDLDSALESPTVLAKFEPLVPEESEPRLVSIPVVDLTVFPAVNSGVVQEAWDLASQEDMSQELWSMRVEHVGYPTDPIDEAIEIAEVASGPAVGALPRERGYDRAFHWRHGVSPWVQAARIPQTSMALRANAEAFDGVLSQLLDRRAVAPHSVRVEDALALVAAEDAGALPPPGRLAVEAVGGPSLFGDSNTSMLHLSVAAGPVAHRKVSAVDLVVVWDTTSPAFTSHYRTACRQLMSALGTMGPKDRVSIVALGGEPNWLCDNASPVEARALSELLGSQPLGGIPDWGRVLPSAVGRLLESETPGRRRQLVIVSSGRGEWAAAAEPLFHEVMAQAAEARIDVSVCSRSEVVDRRIEAWATKHDASRNWGEGAIFNSILTALAGEIAPVGEDVRLTLKFDPKRIAGYRVLGQDGSPGDWQDEPSPVQLLPGERRNCLVEIRWQNKPPAKESSGNAKSSSTRTLDRAAVAELTWRDASGRARRHLQPISQLQFAHSFAQSSPRLQRALLAAEAAQVWMESPFAAEADVRLQRLAALWWDGSDRLRESEVLQRLLEACLQSTRR